MIAPIFHTDSFTLSEDHTGQLLASLADPDGNLVQVECDEPELEELDCDV